MFRISLFTFIIFSLFAVIGLYLPLYLQYKGFNTSQIGLIVGLGSFIGIFAQPFWGFLSDRFKTVKKVLLALLLLAIIFSVPLLSSTSVALTAMCMILFMFFFSSTGPLTESLIVKFANENNRNYGSVRLWGEVGVGIAALWLGMTLQHWGMGIIGWLFIMIGIISMISIIWLPDAKPHATPVSVRSLKKLLTLRPFLLFIGIQLMFGIAHKINDTYYPLYLKELGGSETDIGIAVLIATISAVPTMAFMGFLLKKYSQLFLITIAGGFYVIRWLLYGLFSDPLFIMLLQAMHMITFPIIFVASIQFVYQIVPREMMATGQTLFLSVNFGVGGVIGNFAGGWIYDVISPSAVYYTGAALSLLGLILFRVSARYFSR